MTKLKRHKAIIELLHQKGDIQIVTLCRIFHITEMTARRDLSELQKQNLLIRTHGGAIAMEKKTYDAQIPLMQRLKTSSDEKQTIAMYAKRLLQKDDTIFLGSGSTIDIFAHSLLHYTPLTIISDALNIAMQLYQDSHLHFILLGGELRSNSLTLTGSMAESNLRQFQLKHAFISVNAIDEYGTLYTSSIVESGLLEVLFQQVEHIYVLADSTKLKRKDLVVIHTTKSYTLITTSHADAHILETYKASGIQVHIA